MLAGVNRLRFSFPFTFDPQRLDVIGHLEFIQVQDPSVANFRDSADRCIRFRVNLDARYSWPSCAGSPASSPKGGSDSHERRHPRYTRNWYSVSRSTESLFPCSGHRRFRIPWAPDSVGSAYILLLRS